MMQPDVDDTLILRSRGAKGGDVNLLFTPVSRRQRFPLKLWLLMPFTLDPS